jgi:NADPH:quinone reductase-like Zn-dependent oxidoreductase
LPSSSANRDDLELLSQLLEKGIIKPVNDRRYPLEKAAEALIHLKQGH